MRRTRYQQGNLKLAERKRGPRAWEYRWYESLADGSRKRRSLVVGSVEQYPNEAAAKRAVASLLVNINAESPRFSLEAVSVQTLIEHYREKELGKDSNKTFATCETYQGYFRKWILPRWGNYRLKDVKSVAVEEWLRSLDLSNGSKAKIRNIMHAVFNHAVRWEWHDRNPITHVRQSAKRKCIPTVLTLAEVEELLLYLEEPTHTAVLVDVMTGLRVGELLALKWQDIDFEKFEISVTFRRTYATLLKANGEDVKTVQELLRHANSLVTMNLYAQAVTEVKRKAQSRLVSMLLDDNPHNESTAAIGTIRTYEKIIEARKLLK